MSSARKSPGRGRYYVCLLTLGTMKNIPDPQQIHSSRRLSEKCTVPWDERA